MIELVTPDLGIVKFEPDAGCGDYLKIKSEKIQVCKTHHANINQKKDGVAILISDTVDFRARKFIRDEEGH